MKHLLLVFCVVLLTSCNYFEQKKISSDELLEEELQTFNWKDVDEYPTFASCDSSSGKYVKKQCFEQTLQNIVATQLSKQHIIVSQDVSDTILLKITIDNKGQFTINDISYKPMTGQQIPDLDSLLLQSFDSLPKIYPAIKRSQQVATQFSLPIVVNIQ
ncbi:hypothetical protein [Mangrovimonas sp. YM274]|uniref:hypothetical protein n=1 Tax=Mangrovimonas sp. YM274 TaxID=3070660 RepID=UPI0027DDC6A7|nr:hypothetical protein [Mangrovimonas sp. YM274]WMI68586.1 hypothetical protein RBH95_15740 [Mangrovimonas sp. YM274]